MKKFFKVYRGPGYPVDPKLEKDRCIEILSEMVKDFEEHYDRESGDILEKGFISRNIFIAD